MNFRNFFEAEWRDGKRLSGDDIPFEILTKYRDGRHFIMVAPMLRMPDAEDPETMRGRHVYDMPLPKKINTSRGLRLIGINHFLRYGSTNRSPAIYYVVKVDPSANVWCSSGDQRNPFQWVNTVFADLVAYAKQVGVPDRNIESWKHQVDSLYRKGKATNMFGGEADPIAELGRYLFLVLPGDIVSASKKAKPADMYKYAEIDGVAEGCPMANAYELHFFNPAKLTIVDRVMIQPHWPGMEGEGRVSRSPETRKAQGLMRSISQEIDEIDTTIERVEDRGEFKKSNLRSIRGNLNSIVRHLNNLDEEDRQAARGAVEGPMQELMNALYDYGNDDATDALAEIVRNIGKMIGVTFD